MKKIYFTVCPPEPNCYPVDLGSSQRNFYSNEVRGYEINGNEPVKLFTLLTDDVTESMQSWLRENHYTPDQVTLIRL